MLKQIENVAASRAKQMAITPGTKCLLRTTFNNVVLKDSMTLTGKG